jgi:hypothetical protein
MAFDYNTKRKKLELPEYGRNVQSMVDHIRAIQDRDERNRATKTLINVMGNLNPQFRDQADFKHKLWDHLQIMADFQLDIDSPYEMPKKEVLEEKPNKVHYTLSNIKARHYGKVVQMLIKESIKIEDPERKKLVMRNIANHMKKLYLTWNRDQVNDEVVLNDLRELAGQYVEFPADMKLSESRDLVAPKINNNNNNRNKKPFNPKKKQR